MMRVLDSDIIYLEPASHLAGELRYLLVPLQRLLGPHRQLLEAGLLGLLLRPHLTNQS